MAVARQKDLADVAQIQEGRQAEAGHTADSDAD